MGDIFHVCSSSCDKAADTEKVRVKVEEEATVDTESSPGYNKKYGYTINNIKYLLKIGSAFV